MNANYSLSFIISGGILLLAFLLLINPLKTNKKGNFYFGLFLLLWSTFWLDEVFDSETFNSNFYFTSAKSFIQFLVPLFFYISIKFYTSPSYTFSKKDIRLLFLPIIYLFLLLYSFYSSKSLIHLLSLILIIGNALFYSILAYFTVQKHQRNIETFISNKEPIDLNWIKNIIYIIIGTVLIVAAYSTFVDSSSLNIYANLCFLAVVYMIAYFSIKQGEIYPQEHMDELVNSQYAENENERQKSKVLISDPELEILKLKLLEVMDSEKPYLDSELNLVKLAERLSLSAHQLSFIINNGFNENFFQFINQYKVRKAQDLLQNPKYDNYTIVAIGYESGFNSKTAFNTTFKKVTSYTPTEYRKNRSKL